MNVDVLSTWAQSNPWPAAIVVATALGLLGASVWCSVRALRSVARPQASVVVAAIAAAGCTAYGADTSWRFAAHTLGMSAIGERAALFFVAELALFACALLARANLRDSGTPGTPGMLVWIIVGVQVIPAYAESGPIGGTVRGFIGSVLAGVMWHQAMGIELRHVRPGAHSDSVAALIGREVRKRALSRLGLATRDRTAEQITRDRATNRAVRLAARPALRRWGQRRLAAAVGRAHVGSDPVQKQLLIGELAARRGAGELRNMLLPNPWVEGLHPDTASAVPGAHPDSALRTPGTPGAPPGYAVPDGQYPAGVPCPRPVPRLRTPPDPAASALVLDLAPMPEVHPALTAPAPPGMDPERTPVRFRAGRTRPRTHPLRRSRTPRTTADPPLSEVRRFDETHLRRYGRPAPLHELKREFRIGQKKAQALRAALNKKERRSDRGSGPPSSQAATETAARVTDHAGALRTDAR
jgi:hypothetical protein